jgi:hypothetical protein
MQVVISFPSSDPLICHPNNVAAAVQEGHQVQGKEEQGQLTFNVDEDDMRVDELENVQS